MKNLLLILKIIFITNSCFCQKYVGSDVKPSVLNKTGYLTPLSQISYLKSDDEKDLSNELNEKIIIKSSIYLKQIFNEFDFPAEFIKLDTTENKLYQRSLKFIFDKLVVDGEIFKYIESEFFSYNRKSVIKAINNFVISDTIPNIIKHKGKRLMLSTGTLGFIKTKDYRKNNPKNRVYNYPNSGPLYVLFDSLLDNPNKCCKSINYALIIDAEEKKIAYFNIVVDNVNPANEVDLSRMSHSLFEDYWIWYHPEAQKYLKLKK